MTYMTYMANDINEVETLYNRYLLIVYYFHKIKPICSPKEYFKCCFSFYNKPLLEPSPGFEGLKLKKKPTLNLHDIRKLMYVEGWTLRAL